MSKVYNINAGLDIGNGYTKGKLSIDGAKPKKVDLPSCVSYIGRASWLPTEPDDEYMSDLINELDCDIASSAIKPTDNGRIIFGRRAVSSGRTPIIFNIDDHIPKCDDSLSAQLVLGVLAAEAVQKYWEDNHNLPTESLQVSCSLGIALPFSDYMQYRERYRKMFEGAHHNVHIHNFEHDVTVNVDFSCVRVLAEGQAAQYAITELGPDFLDKVLVRCKSQGLTIDESITGEVLCGYLNTVGIDIGEGTVNFPVFRNGRIAVESSASINKGYGTVLSAVVEEIRNEPYAPESRKDLAELMLKQNPNPQQKRLQARLSEFIEDEVRLFARDVIMEYKAVLSRVKLGMDVVYVYGGGADSVRDILYPMLREASKLDENTYTPVVYLDSSYSRDLNRNGLYQVACLKAE